ncbi:MAG: hypothetical protein ACYS0K_14130 [Planctomycetota bacterium]
MVLRIEGFELNCMKGDENLTQAEDRPISAPEAKVVDWLLRNAEGRLEHLVESVPQLSVVGRCGCGCASVDFEEDSGNSNPIAEAVGENSQGLQCGLILWGREDAVTGLEIYELDPGSASELPELGTLKPWDAASAGE